MKPAILFLAHKTSAPVLAEFEALREACSDHFTTTLVFHSPSGSRPALPRHFEDSVLIADDAGIRNLGFPEFERPPDLGATESLVVPGNVDFLQLFYQSHHPNHPHYWVVESDVRFSGRWSDFFTAADEMSDADLLATSFAGIDEYPDWSWWPSLNVPDGEALTSQPLRCFCPIYRISRTGGELLFSAYRRGWSGHAEVLMPTLFRERGLKLEDLGGSGPFVSPGNEHRFYQNDRLDRDLFPGTLRYRPPRPRSGRRPGMLWHPVKPDDARARSVAWRLYGALKATARHFVDRLVRSNGRVRSAPIPEAEVRAYERDVTVPEGAE